MEDRATSSTVKELAEELGRPVKMVRWKVKKLGLEVLDARQFQPGRDPYVWTEDKLQYLVDHAGQASGQIAEALGVSEKQVREARHRYRIAGRGQARNHTPEEIERRVSHLRGIEKVSRDGLRVCTQCGQMTPVFQFPSERGPLQSGKCQRCRLLSSVWRRYRLSEDRWLEMLSEQGNACAICQDVFSEDLPPHVDHDHGCCDRSGSCGQCVRGLLCRRCNNMIGFLERFVQRGGDPQRIVDYLS